MLKVKMAVLITLLFFYSCASVKPPSWFLDQPALCGVGVHKIGNNFGDARARAAYKAHMDLAILKSVI